MKKTTGKSFFGYIFMFLSICLGVCSVLMAILILSPGTEIFGISYVNVNTTNNPIYKFEDDSVGTYQNTASTISGINIKTGYFNVRFCNSKSISGFKIQCEGKVNGLVKNIENKTIGFKTSVSNGIFYIESVEPDVNLAFNKSVELVIYLPMSSSSNVYPINTKDVTIETNSGNILLNDDADDYIFNNLTIKTETGEISLGKNFTCVSGDLSIEASTGNIIIASNFNGLVEINVKNKARIKLNSINGSLDVNASFSEIVGNNIGGELNYSANGGYIDIGTVNTVNCNREKDSIANLKIGTVLDKVLIANGKESSINIGKIMGDALINTTSGDVNIGEINKIVDITTDSGKINATFNSVDNRISKISSNYGYICVNFENISNADINQYYKGNIDINVKDSLAFFFNYYTNNGIYIFGETTSDKIKIGETTNLKFNNPISTSATINVNNDLSVGNYKGYITLKNGFELVK